MFSGTWIYPAAHHYYLRASHRQSSRAFYPTKYWVREDAFVTAKHWSNREEAEP